MKKLFSAAVMAAALALSPVLVPASAVQAASAEDVAIVQIEVEALIVQYADDAAGLEAAIEALVTSASDPEAAAQAVIAALTNPQSAAAQEALANNPELKVAAGRGLGAAIAMIGLTDPDAAALMQAHVEASGDATLQAAVAEGTDTRTASLRAETGAGGSDAPQDSTPETPASPN